MENSILRQHLAKEVESAGAYSSRLVQAEREAVEFQRSAGRIWEESALWADERASQAAGEYKKEADSYAESFKVQERVLAERHRQDFALAQARASAEAANMTATIKILRGQNQAANDELVAAQLPDTVEGSASMGGQDWHVGVMGQRTTVFAHL